MQHWLEKYGLAFLVTMALACAGYMAGSVAVPQPVPDFALRAREIYRLEIGAAFFVAFYLVTMAVVLAFRGKGFTEFGTQGVKARQVVVPQSPTPTEKLDDQMLRKLESQERRLKKLEAKR